MVNALTDGRELHRWYEHLPVTSEDGVAGEAWELEFASNRTLDMQNKKLTFESDRPKVMFLSRQSKLLYPILKST